MSRSWSGAAPLLLVLLVAFWSQTTVAQEAAAELAPGDKVDLEWAGKAVSGEVLERSPSGWFKVKFTWNGRELTPTLPAEHLRRVAAVKEVPSRQWKDATGKFEIAASFAGHDDGAVRLKKADGKTIKVPLARLSKDDQAYVAALLAAEGKTAPAKPAEPENPFATAEVVRPAAAPAAKAKEYDRQADYSQVAGIVLDRAAGQAFIPDAETPLDVQGNKAAVLPGGGGAANDRFFEGPRGILIAQGASEGLVVLVNSPPGGERRVRVLRANLATMKFAGESEAASFATPVDVSPSGKLLACLPDWSARHHGEPEMIEVVRLDEGVLTPVRRWNLGDHSQPEQRFEQLHFIGEDKLLATSAWGGGIVLWDIDKAQAIWQLKLTSHHPPALSANRRQVAAMIDRTVGIFDTATGDTLASFEVESETHGVLSLSPDGRRLAILGTRVLRVWDIASGKQTGEVWFPKQMWGKSLDWAGGDYVLVDRGFLVDIAKRIVLWEYDLPTGKPEAIATMVGGRYWVLAGGGNSGYQLAGLTVPDAAAKAKGDTLTAAQVLAVKPGAAVSIKINLPGATADEVQKVTKVLIDEARAAGLALTPNAPITIECSIAGAGEETATYRRFGYGFGPFGPWAHRDPGEEATVNKKLSVLSIKENGKEIWVASGHYGAPFQVVVEEGQSVQNAVNQQKGNPVQFFLTAKLPRHVARHDADGTYGKSKLGP